MAGLVEHSGVPDSQSIRVSGPCGSGCGSQDLSSIFKIHHHMMTVAIHSGSGWIVHLLLVDGGNTAQ